MSSLSDTLKLLGYDDQTVKAMSEAARAVAIKQAQAARADMTELTPRRVAAQSAANARLLEQTRSMIRQLSGMKYDLPLDSPVDPIALSTAIRSGTIEPRAAMESRTAVKSNLAQLGLLR